MIKQYIGVSGVSDDREMIDVLAEFYNAGYTMDSRHVPLVGIFVNDKTASDITENSRRYPKLSTIQNILDVNKSRSMPVIRYSPNYNKIGDEFMKFFRWVYVNDLCNTLQLETIWPQISDMKKIKQQFENADIILKLSHTTMPIKDIEDRVDKYNEYISQILIDPAVGRLEKAYDNGVIRIYKSLSEKFPEMSFAFAGNLRPENMEDRITQLANEIGNTDFSISADTGLRKRRGTSVEDYLLSKEKVNDYLHKTLMYLK